LKKFILIEASRFNIFIVKCFICKKITKQAIFHIIQATGKVWADYPINSHAPQRVFPLA
jgi:hypothetical protein